MSRQVDVQVPDVSGGLTAAAFGEFASRVCESLKSYSAYAERSYELARDPKSAGDAGKAALTIGLIESALGRSSRVIEALQGAPDSAPKHFLLGRAMHALGRQEEALAQFERAVAAGWEAWHGDLCRAEVLLSAGRLEDARELIDRHAKKHPGAGLWHYVRGWYLSLIGDPSGAIEVLDQALQQSPDCKPAMFRLAYVLDLQGQEEEAIELYERCNESPPVHVNALINLAVLYEDQGDFDAAEDCLEQVLETHPNHFRAREFLRDVRSAQFMYYDEDQERVREKHNALLDVPVTDFELSVRSRNCLKKMNIHTLGDLLRTSEQQLLSYKNFGETSLNEIRAMLAQKGLRLGQALESITPSTPSLAVPLAEGVSPSVLDKLVSELELSVRSRKCLQRLNIVTLGELAMRTEAELLGIENFGQTSLIEIKKRLVENGLSLRKLDE